MRSPTNMVEHVKTDKRYTFSLEFCGKPTAQHVIRFMGSWVNSAPDNSLAWQIAADHLSSRIGLIK